MSETVLVHLSDLHFGRVDPAIVTALEHDVRAIAPDLVIVSGDLTQHSRMGEFRDARAFLERLGRPFLAVPGNHDITPYRIFERFFDPFRRWREHIHDDIEPVWRDERVYVIGLNSARPAGWSLDWSAGRLNRRQLDGLAKRLAACPDDLVRIVVAHHPVIAPEDTHRAGVLGRAALTLRYLHASGIDLVLSGHLHRSFLKEASAGGLGRNVAAPAAPTAPGVPDPPPLPTGPLVLLAGTATSTRLRGDANAYHVIRAGGGDFAIDRRRWTGGAWLAETIRPGLQVPAPRSG